jgi:hypothetical protein
MRCGDVKRRVARQLFIQAEATSWRGFIQASGAEQAVEIAPAHLTAWSSVRGQQLQLGLQIVNKSSERR